MGFLHWQRPVNPGEVVEVAATPSETESPSGDPERRYSSGWSVSGSAEIRREDGLAMSSEFVAVGQERVLVVFHQPVGAASSGMVLCPSIHAEAVRSQRREVITGWEMSARGIAVARVAYRGTSHSDGHPESMTFDAMVADALVAARVLSERTGATSIGFLGTRLGALVAAKAASEMNGGPLVLWEPPFDLGQYYREIFRARMIGLVKQGLRSATGAALVNQLARDGVLDVVGNPLSHSLYQSTVGLDVIDLVVQSHSTRVLVVQMSTRTEPRPGLVRALAGWRSEGIGVETVVVAHDEAWWFGATGRMLKVETKSDGLEAIAPTIEHVLTAEVPPATEAGAP